MTTPIALPKGSIEEQNGQRFIDVGQGFVPIETIEKGSVVNQGGTIFYTPPLADASVTLDELMPTGVPDVDNGDLSTFDYIGGRLRNIVDSFKEDANKRGVSVSHTMSSLKEGEIPLNIAGLQTGGSVAGLALDTVGSVVIEGLGTGLDTIKFFMPDDVEDAVKEKFVESINYLANTDGGQAAIKAVSGGSEVYARFKEKYPVHAKNLESVLNVGMVFNPSAKVFTGKAAPKFAKEQIKKAGENLNDVGRNIEAVGKRQARAAIKIPKDRANLSFYESFTDLKDTNHLKKTTKGKFKFDASDMNKIETLKKVKGYNPTGKPSSNLKILNDENIKVLKGINKAIDSTTTPIEKSRVINRLDEGFRELMKENPLGNTKELASAINNVRPRVLAALKEMDNANTPSALYKARKKFDQIMKEVKSDQVFTKSGAGSRAVQKARDTMNEMLKNTVSGVGDQLKRSHNIFQVTEKLTKKVHSNTDSHLMGVIKQMIRVNSAGRDIGFVLAGIGIGGTFATMAPILVGSIIGGGVALKAATTFWRHGITAKRGQQAIAAIKRGTGKAIQSLGKDGVSTLKADRAAAIEAIEDAMERWENGGKEESKLEQQEVTPSKENK